MVPVSPVAPISLLPKLASRGLEYLLTKNRMLNVPEKNWENLKYYPRVRKDFLSMEHSSEATGRTRDRFHYLENIHIVETKETPPSVNTSKI